MLKKIYEKPLNDIGNRVNKKIKNYASDKGLNNYRAAIGMLDYDNKLNNPKVIIFM